MTSCNVSVHDLRFRRTGGDECDIVVHGEVVGTVTRRPDIANPDGCVYFAIHLFDDRSRRGRRRRSTRRSPGDGSNPSDFLPPAPGERSSVNARRRTAPLLYVGQPEPASHSRARLLQLPEQQQKKEGAERVEREIVPCRDLSLCHASSLQQPFGCSGRCAPSALVQDALRAGRESRRP